MSCVLRLANTGFVQCFSLGPFLSLYACVCHVLPHKHRVCAVLFSRFSFKKFVRLCFSRFVMRIQSLTNIGFVQCLSLDPLLSFYAYLCLVMLCVLRLKNISFVQCFSLGSLKSLHAYIGHVLSKWLNLFLHFLSTSKRFSRLSVPDAFYKSRKTKSQRAIGLHSCESIFIIFAP